MNQLSSIVGLLNQVKVNALSTDSTTDNLPEGSGNLYFTAARGRRVLSATSPITYDYSNGVISAEYDSFPTDGSSKLVKSGGIKAALDDKQDIISGYTGSVIVVDSVDFTAKTVTTKTLTYSNGILTGVS